MSIIKNISLTLRWYKEANHLSLTEFAAELGIATSSLQSYLDGTANPRADTIELMAQKMHLSVMEMITGPAPEYEQAEIIFWAAKLFGGLSAERQKEGIQLFRRLVILFEGNT